MKPPHSFVPTIDFTASHEPHPAAAKKNNEKKAREKQNKNKPQFIYDTIYAITISRGIFTMLMSVRFGGVIKQACPGPTNERL
jgi:hypothetical protein